MNKSFTFVLQKMSPKYEWGTVIIRFRLSMLVFMIQWLASPILANELGVTMDISADASDDSFCIQTALESSEILFQQYLRTDNPLFLEESRLRLKDICRHPEIGVAKIFFPLGSEQTQNARRAVMKIVVNHERQIGRDAQRARETYQWFLGLPALIRRIGLEKAVDYSCAYVGGRAGHLILKRLGDRYVEMGDMRLGVLLYEEALTIIPDVRGESEEEKKDILSLWNVLATIYGMMGWEGKLRGLIKRGFQILPQEEAEKIRERGERSVALRRQEAPPSLVRYRTSYDREQNRGKICQIEDKEEKWCFEKEEIGFHGEPLELGSYAYVIGMDLVLATRGSRSRGDVWLFVLNRENGRLLQRRGTYIGTVDSGEHFLPDVFLNEGSTKILERDGRVSITSLAGVVETDARGNVLGLKPNTAIVLRGGSLEEEAITRERLDMSDHGLDSSDDSLIYHLFDMLSSRYVETIRRAVLRLGEIEDPRSILPLVGMLRRESDEWIRKSVADVLSVKMTRYPEVISVFREELIRDPNRVIRENAFRALANLRDPEDISLFSQLFRRDSDETIRQIILRYFENVEDSRSVPFLCEVIREEKNDVMKEIAARQLAERGGPQVISAFVDILSGDCSESIRMTIVHLLIRLLRRSDDPQSLNLVQSALERAPEGSGFQRNLRNVLERSGKKTP